MIQEIIIYFMGENIYDAVLHQLRNNEMLISFIGTILVGSLLYYLREVPKRTLSYLAYQFTVSLYIYNDTHLYEGTLAFLVHEKYITNPRKIMLDGSISNISSDMDNTHDNNSNFEGFNKNNKLIPSLGHGYHMFFYKFIPVIVHNDIGETKSGSSRPKTLSIIFLCPSKNIGNKFIKDVSRKTNSSGKYFNVFAFDDWWEKIRSKIKRSFDTVIMERGQKETLINDIDSFFRSKEWYMNVGIPYKRGYLLYGPPGTGKTSFVNAIASQYNLDVYTLNPNSFKSESDFIVAICTIPKGVILLIEDIDAIFDMKRKSMKNNDEDENTELNIKVSLSTLMNVLDGMYSPEDTLIFLTTNHPEKLDDALIRPGRVDRKEYFGYMNKTMIEDMFWRFFPYTYKNEEIMKKFVEAYENKDVTASEVQEVCFRFKDNPENILTYLSN